MIELQLADWRRRVAELYAEVRSAEDPERGHELWRDGRDALFRSHPESPLAADDPLRETGLPYWPYDPDVRFEVHVISVHEQVRIEVATDNAKTTMRLVGRVELPDPIGAKVDLWWLEQYGGGLFLPLRDSTAGHETYGGGRYCLDTAKGSDLGGRGDALIVDFNFLYHPSCRYDPRWVCPLAPAGNTIDLPLRAGEKLCLDEAKPQDTQTNC
ncbi:MAG: DUF1684 domain-containing protein [Acidimicrobiales bacterium]